MSFRRLLALLAAVSCGCALATLAAPARAAAPHEVRLEPGAGWRVLTFFSGRNNYYSTVDDGGTTIIRARYNPPEKTAILSYRLAKPDHFAKLEWRWRVHHFPIGADEKVEGRSDNAAGVYLTFAGTFHRYAVKYVWSQVYPPGTNWRSPDSGAFETMQIVVLEGPPPAIGVWRQERVDVRSEFHRYFGGDPADEPPPVVGVGLLSDGDGTRQPVEADYAGFRLFD